MFAAGLEGGEAQMTGAAAFSSYSQDDQPYQDPPFSNQHGNVNLFTYFIIIILVKQVFYTVNVTVQLKPILVGLKASMFSRELGKVVSNSSCFLSTQD